QGLFVADVEAKTDVTAEPAPARFGLPALTGRTFARATPNGAILVFADNGGWIKPAGEDRFQAIAGYPARGIAAASDFGTDGTGWIAHTAVEGLAPCVARIVVDGR